MEKLTVHEALTIYREFNSTTYPIGIRFLLKKKIIDFNRSWGKQVMEYSKKLEDLHKEHFVFDEKGQIKTEDIIEERKELLKETNYILFKRKKFNVQSVKAGTKNLTTGKYTNEEFGKLQSDILNTEIHSY